MDNELTAKVYGKIGDNVEIRRVLIDKTMRFFQLQHKLVSIFPAFARLISTEGNTFYSRVQITYKDEEGDSILISSDEDFRMALKPAKDLIKFDMTVVEPNPTVVRSSALLVTQPHAASEDQAAAPGTTPANNDLHPHVVCDVCDVEIRGFRFKCLECHDFDLCQLCAAKGDHAQHFMVRVATPQDFSRFLRWKHSCTGARAVPTPFDPTTPGEGDQQQQSQPRTPSIDIQPMLQKFWEILGGVPNPQTGCPFTQRSASSAAAGGDRPAQQPDFDAFLRNIGQNVAAALDPLGIRVEVDIEKKDGGMENVFNNAKKGPEKPAETEQAASTTVAPESTEPQPASAEQPAREIEVEVETPASKPSSEQASRNSPVPEGDWTLVQEEAVAEPETKDKVGGARPKQSIQMNLQTHSDPKIAAALNAMIGMGFTNEGNWLTSLVEHYNGNIDAVLDNLQQSMDTAHKSGPFMGRK